MARLGCTRDNVERIQKRLASPAQFPASLA
jgi:hypothetical protein